jgi:hypothetical protein
MLATRPADETLKVAIPMVASTIAVAGATHAWVAAPLFGLFLLLRFVLQPPAGRPLTIPRRIFLAFLGCSALTCFVWALSVCLAHWRG